MSASSDFSLLWQLSLPQRPRLLAALLCATLAAPLTLLPYGILAQVLAPLFTAEPTPAALYTGAALLILAQLARYGINSLAYYFSHVAAFELLLSLRQQAVSTLSQMPLPALQHYSSGDLKKRVMQDIERLEQFIAHHSVELCTALLTPLCSLGLLLWLDYRLALAALLPLPLAALSQWLLMQKLAALMARFNQGQAQLNSTLVEYIRALPTMQLFGQHSRSFKRLQQALANYQRAIVHIVRQTVPGWSLFSVLINSSVLMLLPVTLYLLQSHALTPPQAILALLAGAAMLSPLLKVARLGSELKEIATCASQLQPLLAPCPVPLATNTATPMAERVQPQALRLQHLHYRYADTPILHPLTLSIPAGQFLALTGPSGAGKTTLAQLLCGLLTPTGGTLYWADDNLAHLNDAQRSQRITLVGQHPQLFSGSLRSNLLLGCAAEPPVSDATLWQALDVAQIAERIRALPNQLETILDEHSRTLSGGERQRICIARALLSPAPVLILDEATAFADALTERNFYQQLRTTYPARTLIVISHRLHAVVHADKIALLANGQLVDTGHHTRLIAHNTLYQQLWHYDGEHTHG